MLDAAWQRLERGDDARLEDVAADVGVSRQSVYLHFGSRGGLLLALVSHMDEVLGLGERIAEAMQPRDPEARLLAVMRLMAEYQPRIHRVAMALLRLSGTDDEVRAALEDRMEHRRRGLHAVLSELSDCGRLRAQWSLDEAVDALWEAGAPSSFEHLVVERGWTPERYGDWLEWLVRSLLT